jgi:[ribosomal protein S5]-alanine N-acetyltransferase
VTSATALETERLVLREPAPGDAAALLAYHDRNRERLERWDPPRGTELAQHASWIAWRAAESAAGRARSWLAFDRASPEAVVGEVQLDAITRAQQHTAMIAYSVDAAYEGKGYASEAVAAVIAYAFGALALESLTATYDPANDRSGALLRRLGFTEVSRSAPIPGFEKLMRAQVLMALGRPA